jgi:hypothetical protein
MLLGEEGVVSSRSRILFVLIGLRLLMPPGICACKQSGPAADLLVRALGKQAPPRPAPARNEDDHAPGCPASYLSQGLGVAPPPGPGALDPGPGQWLAPTPTAAALVAPFTLPPEPDFRPPPGEALYLSYCALRF